MGRYTPLATAQMSYSSGGSRLMVGEINDSLDMQEGNNCQSHRGEGWGRMEAPQNYGFTSVVADADKAQSDGMSSGMIKDCAEGFVSFMGGNRAFPVCQVMDDRRHRLKNLAKDAAKGASAMFGLREWGQQLLNTADGWFMTGNTEKKMRLQLVDNKNGQQQQPAQQQQADAGGGSGGGSQSQTVKKDKGQKTLHKEDSKTYVDMTKEQVHTVRGNGNVWATDAKTLTYHGQKSQSTRVDGTHTHIKNGSQIWVDKGGCYASKPIIIVDDPCDT